MTTKKEKKPKTKLISSVLDYDVYTELMEKCEDLGTNPSRFVANMLKRNIKRLDAVYFYKE